MAITATALSSDLSATGLTIVVASGTGFPAVGTIAAPGYTVRINREFMLAVAQPVAGTVKVIQRGYNGTFAQAHDLLSKVEVSALGSDFADPFPGNVTSMPPYQPGMQTLGENFAITASDVASWGNQPQNFAITKATAIATSTLAAPSKAQDGLTIVFTSLTAAAHVITATSLIADAVSGSPHTTVTFAAFIGATVTLQAQNGLWNLVSQTGITVS
jgi:hypothetical protein